MYYIKEEEVIMKNVTAVTIAREMMEGEKKKIDDNQSWVRVACWFQAGLHLAIDGL
jgi:hypothetical protein